MKLLEQANQAFRNQQYEVAITRYVHVLQQLPALSHLLVGNLQHAQKRYRQSRKIIKSRVCVSGWNLAGNAAGRVATLAQIWEGLAQVEIIGCLFPARGSEIWPPIRNLSIPIHPLLVEDKRTFVQQAIEYVLQHPCDLLHLSKPRFSNIVLGLLYKLIWDCPVLMDIDDEELAFVRATEAIALSDYIQIHGNLPDITDLTGKIYTQIAVDLATAFDGVTVANPALQQRYGGTIVHHARDEAVFKPSLQRRNQSRARLNIPIEHKVILFLGTPREHKGLLETAQAIVQQSCNDLLFLIVGDFPPKLQELKKQIETMSGLRSCLLGNQPFEVIPDILAAGDVCVLLQDADDLAAQYQTPAKLTDALAMGLTVLATPTPALTDLAAQGAFTPVPPGQLPEILAAALTQLPRANQSPKAHPIFTRHLTLAANQSALGDLLRQHRHAAVRPLDANLQTLAKHMGIPLLSLPDNQTGKRAQLSENLKNN